MDDFYPPHTGLHLCEQFFHDDVNTVMIVTTIKANIIMKVIQ